MDRHRRRRPERLGGVWPYYSAECQRDVAKLLVAGGGLSAFRSNPQFPVGPGEGSWAWKLERLAELEFGIKHAIAVNSGTMALMAALKAASWPKGEVVTSPYTFSATAAAIMWMGYQPVFADIDPATFTLDPKSVKQVLTERTVGIVPVDLFGRYAAYDELAALGLPIVQDACQAVGAHSGSKATIRGIAAAWSFNGGKNCPAGEAGMMVTQDDQVAGRARLFVSHGENWGGPEIGLNGRLNEITACVAYHGLVNLWARNEARQQLLRRLTLQLMHREEVTFPSPEHHALYVCPLVLASGVDRAVFAKRLRSMGIEVGEGYIVPPLHKYQAFARANRITMPVVEDLSANRLCILTQVRPPATEADMDYLAEAIWAALDGSQAPKRRRIGQSKPTDF